jgi:BirA family biotin operon repressor/biotin-[acetyl-CoA-carboxylase] ligase
VVPHATSPELLRAQDPIDPDTLARSDVLRQSGVRVEVLDQCTSTNVLLAARARAGEPHASAIVCEHQTAGRGRQGRSWISAPGASLTFSLLWCFDAPQPALSALSLVAGVASAQALESQGARGVQLKWPNDLLFDGRKLGGILVETFRRENRTAAVVGIGLNVADSQSLDDRIGHAVTDTRKAGVRATRTAMLAAQLGGLCEALGRFETGGFAGFRDAWQSRHAFQGRRVRLLGADRHDTEGEVVGVADDGALLLRSAGVVTAHYSGELSLRSA